MLNDDWNAAYMKLNESPLDPEPQAHWLWSLVGMVLGMLGVSLLIAWLIEKLA